MNRRLAALGITVAWLGGMGLLVKRQYFRPRADILADAAARVGPGASYYSLVMGGSPIGYVSSTIDTVPDGISVQNNTVLDIAPLGTPQRVGITTVINLTRDLRLRTFEARFNSDAARYLARGTVDGDTVLNVEIDAGGSEPQRQRIRLERPIVLPDLVSLRLAVGGRLETGRTYTMRVFDPMTLQERETALRVLAESTMVFADSAAYDSSASQWVPARLDTVRAFRVAQEYGGLSLESWIDDQGSIVSARSPVGFTMQRTAFEIAVENWRRDPGRGAARASSGSDIIQTTAIAANTTLDPENLPALRVRLGNVSLRGFDLSGGRQILQGDTLVIRREAGVGTQPGSRPALYDARLPLRDLDTALQRLVEPEMLVQSDDPRIAAQARRIAGRERRAGPVAELLTRWVYDNVEKQITVSVPSAAQVLTDLSGDCNEHTVLYVALARALGLPARTASGVVYLRGRFYYHAWPEVWLGEWVAVDPTFGQFPADAAHLRFVIGGLARQIELVRLIGQLQVTVVGN